jgi:hypothetical protein
MDAATVQRNISTIAVNFAEERRERQQRRNLVASDFDRLRDVGFLLTGVPVGYGGIWESVPRSARPICEMLRILAHGDTSIALVCAMHPRLKPAMAPCSGSAQP